MTDLAAIDAYGSVSERTRLTIQRLLPGPIERVWSYLTDSDLRARWLAAGAMPEAAGARFQLTWRNDELTDPPGARPEGFGAEHSATCTIIDWAPPRRLAYTFGDSGEVSFDLEPRGGKVLLTLIHSRVPDRATLRAVSAGWHAHLDIMAARLAGETPAPFWDAWARLRDDYDRRLPQF